MSVQGLQMTRSLVCILRFELNGLNTHDAHEIIGWITKFRTFVSNVLEVVHRLIGLVEVYHFSFSEQHQLVEHFKDVRIGLVNCLHDCSSTFGEIFEGLHH